MPTSSAKNDQVQKPGHKRPLLVLVRLAVEDPKRSGGNHRQHDHCDEAAREQAGDGGGERDHRRD